MYFTLREFRDRLFTPARLLIWAAVTVICTISGPFNSLQLFSLPGRALFWGLVVAFAILLANAVLLASEKLPRRGSRLLRWVIESVVFGLGFTLFLMGVMFAMFPIQALIFAPPLVLFAESSAICFVVLLVKASLQPRRVQTDPDVAFLKRLPRRLGTGLMRVSSQDHYVEVQTQMGKELILMRFSDALDELSGSDGLQIHRSHWVSRDAVDGVERANGKIVLRLMDGTVVPVSRSYKSAAQDAGLL